MSQSIQSFASKWQFRLLLLLAAQFLLLSFLWWSQTQETKAATQDSLLKMESAAINKIILADKDNSATLKKVDGHWQLPQLQQLPADGFKVEELLTQLKSLKTDWPVATTEGAQQRFEVAEDKFKKRIKLFAGDKLIADLYVGTSPGYKQSHVRLNGDNNIYALGLNSYSLLNSDDEWLDKGLLQAKAISAIAGADFAVEKSAEKWQWQADSTTTAKQGTNAEPDANNEVALDESKVEKAVNKLAMFNVLAVAEKTFDNASFSLTVTDDGKPLTYQFAKVEQSYLLKRSDQKVTFKISQMDYEYFTGLKKQGLVKIIDKAETSSSKNASTDPILKKNKDQSGQKEK